MHSVAIVGASLAGLSAAQALRRRGFDGAITIVGDELHLPYQRPPLSKQFLGGQWNRARLDLRPAEELWVEWHLGSSARSLDMSRREIELIDKHRLPFDGLVIATGARPRKPHWYAELDGVFTLRTVDDAVGLRSHLGSGKRKTAIIGAGFIGSETAATLRRLDCEVTLIDLDRLPMLRILGEELGTVCLRLHEAHGVRMVFGVAVNSLLGTSSVEGVLLEDGRIIEADCVIVGVGAVPNVEWLEGSGLLVQDGVVCDSACAALGAERVVAAGDVASWEHPHYGRLRVEHWENAIKQADAAVRTLLTPPGEGPAYAAIPFFWSDQYDNKLQLIGVARHDDTMRVVEGGLGERRFVTVFEREGRVTAAFLFNSMHRLAAYRQVVQTGVNLLSERATA